VAENFKSTIHLPKTDFPMKADLARREPEFLSRWEKSNLYESILKQNQGKKKFILHDGPPYANGNIHLGHVMNKTLKDIVVKSKTMSGHFAPYVPGWDCHGLPIEHQVAKNLGPKARTISKLELRKECRKYAEKFIDIQREEFKRLGVFGAWDQPYLTMSFGYQAQIAREFANVVEKGYVFRNRKAIHWCISCETALAEAEIEYADHKSPSIFVAYPMLQGPKEKEVFGLIWTTTPWTLPASMAIAYNEGEEYVLVSKGSSPAKFIVAKALVPSIAQLLGIKDLKEVGSLGKGANLKGYVAQHPFLERKIPFLPGEHVTMDAGTGLVHTAPGHGEEDFELGLKYNIEAYSPVQADGTFEEEVPYFAGLAVFKANPKIIEHLKNIGRLFEKEVQISHSYPHCWRCKNPLIFRATAQWFLSLAHNELRGKSLQEIDRVNWVPKWGRDRIYGMIEQRPDWCLSRQRTWGVPIITFKCLDCNEFHISAQTIRHVAGQFEKDGADLWFSKEAAELLPKGVRCAKCGKSNFEKGNDILDVWFDSGASHAAVLEKDKELSWPADIYLEGSDQHRGWFHSALLQSMATRGKAPYVSVITHGFVVDGEGKKMSKSVGNYVSAQEMVKQHGADMLRFWLATEDYRNDVRLSKEIMDRVVESYRRIRNTARFFLGNLYDFNPDQHKVEFSNLAREMDHWALDRLACLVEKVKKAYETYEFHVIVTAINEFCVIEMSSLYLDVAKDILYCDAAESPRRRSVQTLLFEVGRSMATLLAPILPVTAEEIWDFLPTFKGKGSSVHLAAFPSEYPKADESFTSRWEKLLEVRSAVSKALENLRKEKKIGQSLQAKVEVSAPDEIHQLLDKYQKDLAGLWIVSRINLIKGSELSVSVQPVDGPRCDRCWSYVEDVGSNSQFPTLCGRCASVVATL
jgi:isoleucyl-tRNA synthetase